MAGFSDPRLLGWLGEVRRQPSYAVYQRIGERMAALDAEGMRRLAGRRRMRLALLSSFTLDPLQAYLRVECLERDIWADLFMPGFSQFMQQLLNPQSELYAFEPDVCVLQVLPEALVPPAEAGRIHAAEVPLMSEALRKLAEVFRRHCQADLIVSNFALSGRFPYALQPEESEASLRSLNQALDQIAQEIPGVWILDYERLCAYHGKETMVDERLRHIARMEIGHRFLPKLARKILAYALALRGLGRKCVVLDLDDTLWGGVIGEEGLSGIQLGADYPGSAYVEFQRALLALRRSGVLLAINSKNNEADALEALQTHPAMVLRREHFAAVRINWQDKGDNLEAIAEELRLGLDALVFIDDSPLERELIRSRHPEVLVPEWPADPVLYRSSLESLCDFASLSLTAEDLSRAQLYAKEEERRQLRQRSGSLEEYLFSLEMEAIVREASDAELPRVHQLLQKTNQFNLTTRRHSMAQLKRYRYQDESAVYVLHNRDRFGDNGLVGVAILIREGSPKTDVWRIDSLLMSCRILGRTIEAGFLSALMRALKERGCRRLMGEFIPTTKNVLVRDFYATVGFQRLGEREGSVCWSLSLDAYVPPALPWLALRLDESPAVQASGARDGLR